MKGLTVENQIGYFAAANLIRFPTLLLCLVGLQLSL